MRPAPDPFVQSMSDLQVTAALAVLVAGAPFVVWAWLLGWGG